MDLNFNSLLNLFLVILFSTIPLYFCTYILAGKVSFKKALIVTVIGAIITTFISYILPYGGLFAFIILVWIYHEFFALGWFRSILVWVFQILFIIILSILLSFVGLESFMEYFLFEEVI